MIDEDFHGIVTERLEKLRDHLKDEPVDTAHCMVHGRFERIKCSYGTAASSALPTIPIEIPGLKPGYSIPKANIEDSNMIITSEELKTLFNKQVDHMLSVIDEQFDRMHMNHPGLHTVEWILIVSLILDTDFGQVVLNSFRRSWKFLVCKAVLHVALCHWARIFETECPRHEDSDCR